MLMNMVNVEGSLAISQADGTQKAWHHPIHPEIPYFPAIIAYQRMFAFNLGGWEGSPLICYCEIILLLVHVFGGTRLR